MREFAGARVHVALYPIERQEAVGPLVEQRFHVRAAASAVARKQKPFVRNYGREQQKSQRSKLHTAVSVHWLHSILKYFAPAQIFGRQNRFKLARARQEFLERLEPPI